MSEAGRRRWWRAAAVALAGGGVAAGGAWVGYAHRAAAEANHPSTPVALAAGAPSPGGHSNPTPPLFGTVPDPNVVPVSTGPVAPPAPQASLPAPAVPVAPELPVVPPAGFPVMPAAGPAVPLPPAPGVPAAPVVLPPPAAFPAPPDGGPRPPEPAQKMPQPALPGLPPADLAALSTSVTEARPSGPSTPTGPMSMPTPPGVVTGAKAADTIAVEPLKPPAIPAAPAPPAADVPPVPALPAIPPVAATTPPKIDSGLPVANGGTTVKMDPAGGSFAPIVPVVPALPSPSPVEPPRAPVVPVAPPAPIVPAVPVAGGRPVDPTAVSDRPKPTEVPLRDSDKDVFPIPVPPTIPPEPTPGDSNMILLSRSAAAAVLGGALLAPTANAANLIPAPPAVPVTPIVPTFPVQAGDTKTDGELKKQLEESDKKLTAIQNQLKQLTELLNGRRDSDGFPIPSSPGLVADMKALKDRLEKIEKDLEGVKKSQTSLRPSDAGGTGGTPADPKPATRGTVRVVNEYPIQISIVVNGTSYRVAPSKSLDVEVTAGEFTYQLLESGAAPTRSAIKEKETVTLRIK